MSAGPTTGIVAQFPADPTSWVIERLVPLLNDPTVERARIAVAYVTWQGIGHLAEPLEGFLSRGGRLETIYGAGNGVTTPDALLYSEFLRQAHPTYEFAGTAEDEFANSHFHSKVFAFQRKNEIELIVGSANLTRGGLFLNTEAGIHVRAQKSEPMVKSFDALWKLTKDAAKPLSIAQIETLIKAQKLTTEASAEPSALAKPLAPGKFPPPLPPIFHSVLAVKKEPLKKKQLAQLYPATAKPQRLYLQVLEYETGGHGATAGYQVQLPVGCLTAYFGIAPDERRDVVIDMLGETLSVSLTHFGNNTHRIRLRPLLQVPRPAIIVFTRNDQDRYSCSVVPPSKYQATLASKCTEQQRAGARRWGIE